MTKYSGSEESTEDKRPLIHMATTSEPFDAGEGLHIDMMHLTEEQHKSFCEYFAANFNPTQENK